MRSSWRRLTARRLAHRSRESGWAGCFSRSVRRVEHDRRVLRSHLLPRLSTSAIIALTVFALKWLSCACTDHFRAPCTTSDKGLVVRNPSTLVGRAVKTESAILATVLRSVLIRCVIALLQHVLASARRRLRPAVRILNAVPNRPACSQDVSDFDSSSMAVAWP